VKIIHTTTVAGTGTAGYNGDGILATEARLNYPNGVIVAASGNLYIADTNNHRVRKVTKSSGLISTYAGTGTAGYSGDGGLATEARLYNPTGIYLDYLDNLYIGDIDSGYYRVVIFRTGIIIYMAGGDGTKVFRGNAALGRNLLQYSTPSSLFVVMRMITGAITTTAGNGTAGYSGDGGLATKARLNKPTDSCYANPGDIYIADSGNNCIRLVTVKTGIITTVAGDGNKGYNGDGGLATLARLNNPRGVYVDVDRSNNVYISDTGNNCIRLLTVKTGIITTVAGDGTAVYTGDGGLATLARLHYPIGVAFDTAGDVFVADFSSNSIRMIRESSGIITTIAGNGSFYGLSRYGGGYGGDGGLATSARLLKPAGVTFDVSSNLYIADSGNNRIRIVTKSTGIISTAAGTGIAGRTGDGGLATSARLSNPRGVAFDSSGNLYIADTGSNLIRTVTKSTGIISIVAGNGTMGYSGDGGLATLARLSAPSGVALDLSGNIYIADTRSDLIRVVMKSTGIISTVAGTGLDGYSGDGGLATSAMLSVPSGVLVDAADNLYIADTGNNRIRMVTKSTGVIASVAGNGTAGYSGDGGIAISARLNYPNGITIDALGNIYIADSRNNRIRELSTPSTPRPSRRVVSAPAPSISVASSLIPSLVPSLTPSVAPSLTPSVASSLTPSVAPSLTPSMAPSLTPSVAPSLTPSMAPSLIPSVAPTPAPSSSVGPAISFIVAPSPNPTLRPPTPASSSSIGPSMPSPTGTLVKSASSSKRHDSCLSSTDTMTCYAFQVLCSVPLAPDIMLSPSCS
jgi:trimeric autotransporter adhesin